jgi:hypothetical protein
VDEERSTDSSWSARPVLATSLRVVAMVVPVLVSLALTVALRRVVPTPDEAWLRWAWALALLLIAVTTAIGVERLARRLMPLVTLLKLSMLFPDRAPSRFAVARQAGSVRGLEAQLAEDDGQGEASWSAAKILSLCVALRSHDRRTRGHAERVRVFTDLLGEELELPEEDRYRLRWAALLHDIGKLTVSSRILNKPGALDDAEWVKIKAHPETGARIAGPLLAWLGPWGDAIAQHHERFDGKGYPAGLAGSQISMAGRIVAVADCYDTMTAARSYKKPMAVWAARRELADCAGGQFDPEMVRAFLSISLPKLLWRTGPVSFVIQLPFLWRLQEVGLQSVTAVTQGATVATVAAGVTALAAVGPVHTVTQDRSPVRDRAATATAVADPTSGGQPTGGQPAPEPAPTATPAPQPQPTPTPGEPVPSPSPGGTPSPTAGPRPTPTRTPDPSPTASPTPTRTPEPSRTPTPEPLPIPLPTSTPLPLPLPTITPLPTLPPLPPLPPLPLPLVAPGAAERADDNATETVAPPLSRQQL